MKKKIIKKKQLESPHSPLKMNKGFSLSELSISEILQLKTNHDSVDFQHERDLITDLFPKVDESSREYGLTNFSKKTQKKPNKKHHFFPCENEHKIIEDEAKASKEKLRPHQQLCFDKDKKRKVSLKKYKSNEKIQIFHNKLIIENPSQINCSKLKQKQDFLTQNLKICSAKPISPLCPKLKKKNESICLDEKALKLQDSQKIQESCSKIYHLREDEFKKQINDLNINLHFSHLPEFNFEKNSSSFLRSSSNSCKLQNLQPLINHFLDSQTKKQEQSKKMFVNHYFRPVNLKSSEVTAKHQIHEVKRPLSVDCNPVNYRYSESHKQSPYSRDSSTGTQKTVKRGEFVLSQRNKIQSSYLQEKYARPLYQQRGTNKINI